MDVTTCAGVGTADFSNGFGAVEAVRDASLECRAGLLARMGGPGGGRTLGQAHVRVGDSSIACHLEALVASQPTFLPTGKSECASTSWMTSGHSATYMVGMGPTWVCVVVGLTSVARVEPWSRALVRKWRVQPFAVWGGPTLSSDHVVIIN